MTGGVFDFELNGNPVLGFDTGLDSRSFAQAKMAQLIANPGSIVYPDGRIETWRCGGVIEFTPELEPGSVPSMIIWGPYFPGERLLETINSPNRKDEALGAFCYWLKAATALDKNQGGNNDAPFAGPAGAFIVTKEKQGVYPAGTVFFPPSRLLGRSLDAEGPASILDAASYVHPDRDGKSLTSFSTGAMLYRIFCGKNPFLAKGLSPSPLSASSPLEELQRDIREGVFIPPALSCPGIDPGLSDLITRSLSATPIDGYPAPEDFLSFFTGAGSRTASSWIKPLSKEEIVKIQAEKELFGKRKAFTVKTRRFVIRNTAIIAGSAIGLIVLILILRGFLQHLADLPSTRGMTPIEVAASYYNAFGELEHPIMSACVSGRAGKQDIDLVLNLFVNTRVRQAYELDQQLYISAQEWIDAGSPPSEAVVFGVTDLAVSVVSQDAESAVLEAEYILWAPAFYFNESAVEETRDLLGEAVIVQDIKGSLRRDTLKLFLIKGAWRITEIKREN